MATKLRSNATFGAQLRRLRIAAGLTQEALAERSGLSPNAISALERGERRHPYPRTIQVLADALDMPDDERRRLAASVPKRLAHPYPDHALTPAVPVPTTPFFGRQREVETVVAWLRDDGVRLLTLTGPGGVGKTRLALRVATELRDEYADGVWFVSLAPITDPGLVTGAIVQALAPGGDAASTPADVLIRFLRDRETLLVLDNFEQVRAAAAGLAEVLQACPGVTAIVTSRLSLHVDGEQEYPVPPLGLPDSRTAMAIADLAKVPAVALFVQRARSVRPAFAMTPENAGTIAELCARLDGLPLAIELAAARSRLLSPQAILDRLSDRLTLLVGGGADRPARLQTMRGAIAWSFDHLGPDEQILFRRLSVFVGGCTLDAVGLVAGGGADVVTRDSIDPSILDRVEVLVDHSLVLGEEGPDSEVRLGMLETIREFGAERLVEAGEAEAVRSAHARYFLELASVARQQLEGPERRLAHGRVQREQDNLRAALGWLCERHDIDGAQRLATDLARFWTNSGNLEEGRRWMDRVLALPGESFPRTRVDTLYWASILALLQQDLTRATGLGESALALARADGNQLGTGMALVHLGDVVGYHDPDRAQALVEQGLIVFRDLYVPFRTATAYRQLGELAIRRGDFDEAATHHATALRIWEGLEHPWGVPVSLRALGEVALATGDLPTARSRFHQSLERWRELDERLHMSDCLGGLARVTLLSGDGETATLLLSARARLDQAMGYVHAPEPSTDLIDEARATVDAARFDEIWNDGQSQSIDQVLDDVMLRPLS